VIKLKTVWTYTKWFINIVVVLILWQLFGLWGVAGYIVFMLLMAGWVLWLRRDLYLTICRYGAHALDKYFTGRKEWKKKQSEKN
jgi:hypothetical protein